ncbi:RICIN domain-containing protein, partial [Bacillus mycoides]|uniref:RICIN domain-containing protein n=1 Tax=Bacillus mycoides TaxID=1405 RepID=UPI003D655D76
ETGNFKDVKKLYDVKLTPKMNFTLKTAVLYDGAEKVDSDYKGPLGTWYYTSIENGGNTGEKQFASSSQYAELQLSTKSKNQLNKNTDYYLSMYMKADSTTEPNIEILGEKGTTINTKQVELNNKGYQRVDILMSNSIENPIDMIRISGNGETKVYWDDVSITEVSALSPYSEGIFEIAPALRSKSVVTWDEKNENPNPIVLYTDEDKENQKWIRTYDKKKQAYQFKSVSDENKVLSAQNSENGDIYPSVISIDNKFEDHQYWILEKLDDNYYFIRNKAFPEHVLDVDGGNPDNGTRIKLAKKHPSGSPDLPAQKFNLRK